MEKAISFAIRWFVCSLGLWITVKLFGSDSLIDPAQAVATFLLAGLIFSAVNAVIKPIITILSLPFVLITMGLFTLVINGFMVWLTIYVSPNIRMSFPMAIISSLVLSLINYLLNNLSPMTIDKEETNETR